MIRRITLTASLLMLVISAAAFAQNPIDKLVDKYGELEGFTVVSINEGMLKTLSKSDNATMKASLEGLEGIRVISYEHEKGKDYSQSFYKDILNTLPLDEYKEFMTVKEKDTDVRFLTRKSNDKIHELLLIVKEDGEVTLVSIVGEVDLDKITNITKSIKGIQGAFDGGEDEDVEIEVEVEQNEDPGKKGE